MLHSANGLHDDNRKLNEWLSLADDSLHDSAVRVAYDVDALYGLADLSADGRVASHLHGLAIRRDVADTRLAVCHLTLVDVDHLAALRVEKHGESSQFALVLDDRIVGEREGEVVGLHLVQLDRRGDAALDTLVDALRRHHHVVIDQALHLLGTVDERVEERFHFFQSDTA